MNRILPLQQKSINCHFPFCLIYAAFRDKQRRRRIADTRTPRNFATFAEIDFKKFLALIFLKRLISGIDVPDNSGMLFVS